MRLYNYVKGKFDKKVAEVKEDWAPADKLTVEQRDARRVRHVSKIMFGLYAVMMAMSVMGVTCFAEGDAGEKFHIKYLGKLPLFNADGSIK